MCFAVEMFLGTFYRTHKISIMLCFIYLDRLYRGTYMEKKSSVIIIKFVYFINLYFQKMFKKIFCAQDILYP